MTATELVGARDCTSEACCLPDLLLSQAASQPDGIAIIDRDQALTFAEVVRRSTDLAACLRDLDVRPDDCVGVFLEPSLELIVGVWGILFSGGAYLPLSPEYPEARLRYMIENSGTKIVLSQEALKKKLANLIPGGTRIVTFEDAAHFNRGKDTERTPRCADLRPNHLAYVIYTSGSTGRPKGVMIEHGSIVNQMCWLKKAYGIDRQRVVLQKTPISFDAAQWEILAAGCGATVVMADSELYRDPEGLIETINTYHVTTLQCVPTLLRALVDTGRLSECVSLTQLFSGGEALSRALASECLEALPWCELVNLYGPTECTINSSAFTVERDSPADQQVIPIGVPVANTRYYILDDKGKPVESQQVGEVHISGVQVARGYLRQPELTEERFITNPFTDDPKHRRLFKTGDLAYWTPEGTAQFVGRVDNQVKLRGFRIELDEISSLIEAHDWVKRAAVIVKEDPRTSFQNLIACVELDPREAVLMDENHNSEHHRSKQNKLQVQVQLSNPGLRDSKQLAGRTVVALPGKEPTESQRREVFARKTYRFFEGGPVSRSDLLRLLSERSDDVGANRPVAMGLGELGEILRYFGQFHSEERLLPKYGYASPGALYATQMYLEITSMEDLRPGCHYYHPANHELILIDEKANAEAAPIKIHFVGKRQAIELVYRNNVEEVLEIEVGHMIGLFEKVLPRYGFNIDSVGFQPTVITALDCADDDYYMGTFQLVPWSHHVPDPAVDIYVQAHPGMIEDLSEGQYRYRDGELRRVSDELILHKQVIAINQSVYERASFGITVVSRAQEEWLQYIELGRTLQRLSMNNVGLGFMSSGYSSKTGNPLPSAKRIDEILSTHGLPTGPSYFFVGGRVSVEQRRSEGMKEDAVHMKGPAEMIRDDLANFLPDYMIPNKVVVLDALPLTANGKTDVKALIASDKTDIGADHRPFIAPRTTTERKIAEIWRQVLKRESVSVLDDFFELGGNSLIGVSLIKKINQTLGTSLPLQVLFECPTVEKLAFQLRDAVAASTKSRLVPLWTEGTGSPIFCWPGLGGYTMNLRLLAATLKSGRPFYGVQACGINDGETPYDTISRMAAEDLREIRRRQPTGPYTLWGYSFGARVAFEAACQLEQSGEQVENLFLIAPGSPKIDPKGDSGPESGVDPDRATYLTILFSVFAGTIEHPGLEECLRFADDDASFRSFISREFNIDPVFVDRVAALVDRTYLLKEDLSTLTGLRVRAPVTVFNAYGDSQSFIEHTDRCERAPTVVNLSGGHYSILKDPDIGELVTQIRHRLGTDEKETVMPHVHIKHFPVSLTDEQRAALVTALTEAVKNGFDCDEGVISIALEPVEKEQWHEKVYLPEIVGRKELLCKLPSY